MKHRFLFTKKGMTCVYTDAVDLAACGDLTVRRISNVGHVTGEGWYATIPLPDGFVLSEAAVRNGRLLSVVYSCASGRPPLSVRLGPYAKRADAIRYEVNWIQTHLLDFLAGVSVNTTEPAVAGGG